MPPNDIKSAAPEANFKTLREPLPPNCITWSAKRLGKLDDSAGAASAGGNWSPNLGAISLSIVLFMSSGDMVSGKFNSTPLGRNTCFTIIY